MPGYKHPCRYCNELIEADSKVCPKCGKVNPLGPLRCPKCHTPIQEDWKVCSNCGQTLEVKCPKCGKMTFMGDYCEHCDARLTAVCSKCKTEQALTNEKCIKCGKPLKK